MKITSLQAVYPRYRHMPPSWRTHLWQIVVRVETDTGVVGFGSGGGGIPAVEIVNRHMAELTVGMRVDSPADIAVIWDHLYEASTPYGRKGVAIMALSGIDLALWDALGRAESRPVKDLIGGPRRDSVPVYATGPDSDWYAELGITGQKISHRWTGDESDYDSAEQRVAGVRQVLGPDANVMIDSYMTWTFDVSVEMARRLQDLKVHWFEDVLTPDDLAGHAALKGMVRPTLIAGGNTNSRTTDFARSHGPGRWTYGSPTLRGAAASPPDCESSNLRTRPESRLCRIEAASRGGSTSSPDRAVTNSPRW